MLILSVAEYVVRKGLKEDNKTIIGPGNVKMKRPSLMAIYRMFYTVAINVYLEKPGRIRRKYGNPL